MGKTVTDELIMLPSVTKLKGRAQLAEIERRLTRLYEDCRGRDAAVTRVHIRTVLGIDDNTMQRWLSGKVQCKGKDVPLQDNPRICQEAGEVILERRECLKKWLDRAETSCMEAISANPKAGGPMFQAKAVFGYREKEEASINMQVSLEDFLKEVHQPNKTPGKEGA